MIKFLSKVTLIAKSSFGFFIHRKLQKIQLKVIGLLQVL